MNNTLHVCAEIPCIFIILQKNLLSFFQYPAAVMQINVGVILTVNLHSSPNTTNNWLMMKSIST